MLELSFKTPEELINGNVGSEFLSTDNIQDVIDYRDKFKGRVMVVGWDLTDGRCFMSKGNRLFSYLASTHERDGIHYIVSTWDEKALDKRLRMILKVGEFAENKSP